MDKREYETFLRSRPSSMETNAIKIAIACCEASGVRCHIVHLATGDAVQCLREAQNRGT